MTGNKQSIQVLTVLRVSLILLCSLSIESRYLELSLSTDAEKDHISKYMARAFDKTDPGSWLATGQMVISQSMLVVRIHS